MTSIQARSVSYPSSQDDVNELAMGPIDRERRLLADWQPTTSHTDWQDRGRAIGGISGLLLGAAPGASIALSRNATLGSGLAGLALGVVGGAMGGMLGAGLLGSALHRLDDPLSPADAQRVKEQHAAKVDAYSKALDQAEAAVRRSTGDDSLMDVWQDLMEARPTGMPLPPSATTPGDDYVSRAPNGDHYGDVPMPAYG